jgi:hypothetical protein
MTVNKQLTDVFNLPESEEPTMEQADQALAVAKEVSHQIVNLDEDKIDNDIDNLTQKAVDSYENLMNLGMNVESRFAAPIFDAASKMLGHAVTAKLGKAQKKLKEAELALKAAKMKADMGVQDDATEITATVFDRNDLIKSLKQQ